ncbi:MAG: AfsR/SARP family transcriptional regulator, partial [Acidimicrobiales bacterium]
MVLRFSLVGQFAISLAGTPVDTAGLGRTGRLAFAYLVSERHRPVARDELADVVWGEDVPRSWETALRGLISKIRSVMSGAGLPPGTLVTAFGCYQLALPAGTEVDAEMATAAVAEAEGALARGEPAPALERARAAAEVAARQFLVGSAGHWVERRQAEVREVHLRALELISEAAAAMGEWSEAVAAAEQAIVLEPFREPAHLRLMAAHAGAGNRAAALRAY